jgi:molybdopterin molybdotransferase
MISLEQACEQIELGVSGMVLSAERIDVHDGLNRVVAAPQRSKLDLPPFNKSAMDGYAVLAGDNHQEYQLLETVAAGYIPQQKLQIGTVIKVMTGAPVPHGTDKVIPVELAKECNGKISFVAKDNARHICLQGEDVCCGDLIMPASTLLGSVEIANLISCGITQIEVYRKPKIAIISTGDEIVDDVEKLTPGKIMNSNGPLLKTLCERYNYEVVLEQTVTDDLNDTTKTLDTALQIADIIIFSGGVSVGDFDYVTEAINHAGLKTYFNRVAIKPGKPTMFAASKNKLIFGLPGNPVAVYLTFHLFVRRAIDLMHNCKSGVDYISLPLQKDFVRRKTERAEFVPCKLSENMTIQPIEFHGSAHLSALLQADGFFVVPKGIKQINAQENVQCVGFD